MRCVVGIKTTREYTPGIKVVSERLVGEERSVSLRAIGVAFHRIYPNEEHFAQASEHEKPCECYVCKTK